MPETVDSIVGRLSTRDAGIAEANIQADVAALLRTADLDLDVQDLALESPASDRRRIDVEVGRTVIEVKRNLRRADMRSQGEDQLLEYLLDRESTVGERYVGILTDGADWILFRIDSSDRNLREVANFSNRGVAHDLVVWLEGALATKRDIDPVPLEIEQRIGVNSSSYRLDIDNLHEVYRACFDHPEVSVKRQLWERLLKDALGMGFAGMSAAERDSLFVRHTYLVAVAEVIAHLVIGVDVASTDPVHLMSGAIFRQHSIGGVVESDFFDWVNDVADGRRFVRTLARRLARFDFAEPNHDVLKVLYESVIDSKTRHSLGEYYTPDWLAEQVVEATIDAPMEQRVLDPACGSGTFLFWSIRRILQACEEAGLPTAQAIERASTLVSGIDLHPVAVTLARVTVLLAIGRARLRERNPFAVQVYLGDSMMWRQPDDLHGSGGIQVFTSDGQTLFSDAITIPQSLLSDIGRFDRLLADLTNRATAREPLSAHPSISGVLVANGVVGTMKQPVEDIYSTLCRLHDERRNHIWGYYIRNLARPFSLAQEKVDRLVGNPPWLAFRYMDEDLKKVFKEASKNRGLWGKGSQATHQDLSGYFVARSVERFLDANGEFGFVMPVGVLKGRQYENFRAGDWSTQVDQTYVDLGVRQPWRLVDIKPDPFPMPGCVIFGSRSPTFVPLPRAVEDWHARLPKSGNLSWDVVEPLVTVKQSTVRIATGAGSPYRDSFSQGSNLVPRMLLLCEDDSSAAAIGAGTGRRAIRSGRSIQEKAPWKDLESLRGNVEERFVRRVHVGETILPFRVTESKAAVIPWDGFKLLNGVHNEIDLYPGLASWWREAELLRKLHAPNGLDLNDQIDYRSKLSNQLPGLPIRVVYTKSGTNLAAAVLSDNDAVIDHKLYWGPVESLREGYFLAAVLNSDLLLAEVVDYQPVGNYGPRDFDKYVFEVPFPRFDPTNSIHSQMADVGLVATDSAAAVDVAGLNFKRARSAIRESLRDAGILEEMDELLLELITTP